MDTNNFDKPMGGTEIMRNQLMGYLSEEQKEIFSIFNYVGDADFKKTTIFWNQLSYDQAAVQWLSDPKNVEMVDHFVFVSYWQAERFRQKFGIPGFKSSVIQNACLGVEPRNTGPKETVKLCYTSTPWRGLDVLLDAWDLAKPEQCELHIFSSCKIYGPQFAESEEAKYTDLYNRCLNTKGVVYRGSVSNEELRSELSSFDILAYPNTFEETSCISVIDALSAGLRVITSSLGALPETTEGWAVLYPFMMDPTRHAEVFSKKLIAEIEAVKSGLDLDLQRKIYSERWSWETRLKQWTNFLDTFSPKQP